MAMSEKRRAWLEASRARQRELRKQRGPLTPEQERLILAHWLLMGLPDPRPPQG